jgi:hypothetical protein
MKKEVYLGDGVYAEFDGFAVTIYTDRAEGRHYIIVLEPREFEVLQEFWKQAHETKTDS